MREGLTLALFLGSLWLLGWLLVLPGCDGLDQTWVDQCRRTCEKQGTIMSFVGMNSCGCARPLE